MKSILFVTFDYKKPEYPPISYSTACLIAALDPEQVDVKVLPFDVRHGLVRDGARRKLGSVEPWVAEQLQANRAFIDEFDFIAIPLMAWTEKYVESFLRTLDDFRGRVVLGGYQVSALSDDALLSRFPRVDYFIRGYAELDLPRIVVEGWQPESKIIDGEVGEGDLVSPYLSGVLNTYSKSIHWETVRGCPHRCGFCEWGNSRKKNIVSMPEDRIDAEIELFRNRHVGHVNILDGAFNSGKNYLDVFRKLLSIPGLRITCQARFERLCTAHGRDFLALCAENADRVHLEFGLQTIHANEAALIGRKNNLPKIEQALALLREGGIDFETSLIYAIPGQTPMTFVDSIEFLLTNGCSTVRAFPLRIPANSGLRQRQAEFGVVHARDRFTVESVGESESFTRVQRASMDVIAAQLSVPKGNRTISLEQVRAGAEVDKATNYQWRIGKVRDPALATRIVQAANPSLASACSDLDGQEGRLATFTVMGNVAKYREDHVKLANKLLGGEIRPLGIVATVSEGGRLYVWADGSI